MPSAVVVATDNAFNFQHGEALVDLLGRKVAFFDDLVAGSDV